jgi:hypothetical protein
MRERERERERACGDRGEKACRINQLWQLVAKSVIDKYLDLNSLDPGHIAPRELGPSTNCMCIR